MIWTTNSPFLMIFEVVDADCTKIINYSPTASSLSLSLSRSSFFISAYVPVSLSLCLPAPLLIHSVCISALACCHNYYYFNIYYYKHEHEVRKNEIDAITGRKSGGQRDRNGNGVWQRRERERDAMEITRSASF